MPELSAADHDQLRYCLSRAVEQVERLERATAGLTPEQIEAIPRLVAWYTGPADYAEGCALRELFPRRCP